MREIIRQKIVDSISASPAVSTRRDVHVPAVPGKTIAVIGPRRAGKTTFLWQVISRRLEEGTAREALLYFNFEDDRLAGMAQADLDTLVEEYYLLYPELRDQQRVTFLLDEIQTVGGWEVFVRRLIDTEKIEVYLSGSSARLLSREVATSMRGRAMEALVLPFSFREFLRHKGLEPGEPSDRLSKAARSVMGRELQVYLRDGGFPEAQNLVDRDRSQLLSGYVDTVLLRDVVERHGVTQPVALRWMARQLLGNAGGAFSVNKFSHDLRSQGFRVGKDTLHAYLAHLEDAFLIRTTSIATESERRRMTNPRKAYPVDPALIGAPSVSARANEGHALETVVALELERRGAQSAYVKTRGGHEVDFLARYPDGREELIQVCADLSDAETRTRETRALVEAKSEYPEAGLLIVVGTSDRIPDLPASITVRPAWAWLLSE